MSVTFFSKNKPKQILPFYRKLYKELSLKNIVISLSILIETL